MHPVAHGEDPVVGRWRQLLSGSATSGGKGHQGKKKRRGRNTRGKGKTMENNNRNNNNSEQ
jgi:hypothetical protein